MDWKSFADRFETMTCILSVEKKPDGRCGAVRIVTGNGKYLDSLALAAGDVELGSEQKVEFVPNSEYTRYIPKDLNFEDVCFRCAVLKQPIHNCVHAIRYPFDIMVYFMPLSSSDENIGYCTYSQVLLPKTDNNLMAMNISQETAMDIIGTCIKLREDRPFGEIMQTVVEDIRSICDAEFCCVLLLDDNQRKCSVLGEAKAPGSPLSWMENYLDDDFYSLAETWRDTLSGSFCLVVSDERDMDFIRERNPQWYQSLMAAGVERLVLFPLIPRGQFLGYIFAANFQPENTQHIRDSLELTTYFIASEIANNRFIDQLRELSKIDLLTGVMNRNAMNARIDELGGKGGAVSGAGLIFTDLNGLKYVNDHLGHMAGDQLLKDAAVILKSTFAGSEIYRAGGDEFLILMENTDEASMQEKISDIKKKSSLFEHVSFSAGCVLLHEGDDLRAAIPRADEKMYRDKESFYADHPKLKRDR